MWLPMDGSKKPEGRVNPVVKHGVRTVRKVRLAARVVAWVMGSPRSKVDRCCNTAVFGTPMAAEFLPFLADLVFARLWLDGNVSVGVKPCGPEAAEHVR